VEPGDLSPRNYAPHLSDPDPDPEPMSKEEIQRFANNFGKLLQKVRESP
jgi:hypothetical protein